MRWSRLAGLIVGVIVAIAAIAGVAQLGESLFDHGGMLPTLVLVVAVLLVAVRLGIGNRNIPETAYW